MTFNETCEAAALCGQYDTVRSMRNVARDCAERYRLASLRKGQEYLRVNYNDCIRDAEYANNVLGAYGQ